MTGHTDPVIDTSPVYSVRADECQILSVSSISLHHFRNHAATKLEVTQAPVVLTGKNGVGKTNILEAISLLTPGRGLRRARLSDLDQQQASSQPWIISAHVYGIDGNVQIGTGRSPDSDSGLDKRVVRVDGVPLKSQNELAHHMSMIWLTPQMEQLFQEGASASRKFLDRLVYSFDGQQASRLNQYEHAMRERNKLLMMHNPDPTWLSSLEERMASSAVAIALARLHTIEHINSAIAQSPLSFPKALLSIVGMVEDIVAENISALEAEERFSKALHDNRSIDRASGRTLIGIHRSELSVLHIEKHMLAQFCSTGEQKALLLSIVLAQARASMQWRRIVPVLLLDEVVAHLDSSRRRELFEEICQIGAQTWMTGTDPVLFEGLAEKSTCFEVENGSIKPK